MTSEITSLTAATYPPTDKQRGALKTKRDEIDPAERLPKPNWIRVKAGSSERFREIKDTVRTNKLVTVCEEASCPNIGECWEAGTATFMILGDVCTRACKYCAVAHGLPTELDLEEPIRVEVEIDDRPLFGHEDTRVVAVLMERGAQKLIAWNEQNHEFRAARELIPIGFA